MDVDIVIPTHAEGRYLAAAIESALAQTHRNLTLTVVDNGPGGGHAARVVERYRSDPRVRYVVTGGVPADESWSRCIQLGSAPLVALLHHDELYEPAFLAHHVAALEAHPECAFAFSGCRVLDEHDEPVSIARARVRAGVLPPEEFVPLLYADNRIPTCSILVRRSAYEAVGPRFDLRYTMGMDWEMWLRIAVRFPVVHLPVLDSLGRVHGESVSARSSGWGTMRLVMVERGDALIAREMPGFRLPAGVRDRAVASAHTRLAYEALEHGDRVGARRSLAAALHARPVLVSHPRTVVAAAGAFGGARTRHLIFAARRLETRWRLRGRMGDGAFRARLRGRQALSAHGRPSLPA